MIPLLHTGEHVILSCMFVDGKEMITAFNDTGMTVPSFLMGGVA